MDRLRAVVVGTGFGRNHAEAYSEAEGVDLAGFCVRKETDRSVAVARRFQVMPFRSIPRSR